MSKPTAISFGLRDIYSRPKRVHALVPNTTTLANVQTFVTSFAPLLFAIQGCKIEVAEVTYPLTLPAGLDTATADINGQEGARFSFDNDSLNKYSVWVPGILPTYKVGLKGIDTSPQAMVDFIAAYVAGLGGVVPVNEAGLDVGTFVRAIQSHNK